MAVKIDIKQRERPEPTQPEAPVVDPASELEAAHVTLDQALRLGDAETLQKLLAPNAQLWGPGGQVLERQQWLAGYASSREQQVVVESTEELTNLYGDTAVTSVVQHTRVRHGRRQVSGHFRITYTWARTDDAWRLAAVQYTPLVR
jgi:hypothetical protein